MKCSNCGQECADDLRFCTNCGMELPEQADGAEEVTAVETVQKPVAEGENDTEVIKIDQVEVEEKREKKTRAEKKAEKEEKKAYKDSEKKASPLLTAWISGLSVLVLLVIVLNVAVFREKPYEKLADKAVIMLYDENDKWYITFYDGEKLELNDEQVRYRVCSTDNTVLCYRNEHEELVVIKDGELMKTGIEGATGVKVSDRGDTIAYFTDEKEAVYQTAYGYKSTIQTGTLHLYEIDKKKDTEIATDVVIESATLSPDGETVAYVTEYEATDNFTGYYSVKGRKPVEVGKEKRVFAVADKAKYVYYMDGDRIYVQKKGKEEEKLASGLASVEVHLNKDYTELLYLCDGKTYLSVRGGEKKKVSGEELNLVLLPETAASGSYETRVDNRFVKVSYTGVDTFKEKVMYSESDTSIIYITDAYEEETLASDVGFNEQEYVLSEDYESLVYLDNLDVVKVTEFQKGGLKTVLDDEAYAWELYSGGNLKYVYYVNGENELYCIRGKKAKKIADDVTSVCESADGKYCYYVVEDEKYCYSKKGRKGKELLEEEGKEIFCYRSYNRVYAEVNDGETTEVFRMDGKEAEIFRSYEENGLEAYFKGKYSLIDPFAFFFD